jgi:basic amino acid/polyamine antiporter, APA family
MASLLQQALRRKPVSELTAQTGTDTGGGELERSIGLFQLSTIGIGATIGTGIFFVLSQAVPIAGPAVVWSFVVAGVVAGLTAVCYAELTSAVPVSGSSYSYAYATLGEVVAMGVAACLLLEYGVSAAAVAVGWSEYLNQLLGNVFGVQIPEALSNSPESGGILNLPAVVLVALCALLLIRGTSESAKVNATMVVIKLAVLVLFIVIGVTGWNAANFTPFAPGGFSGVMTAAGVIFFSFIGLDAVSTAGEEVKNPRRNMPLAIMIALVVVTGLYIAVSVVALGAQPTSGFEDQEAGLAAILQNITGSTWPGTVVAAAR